MATVSTRHTTTLAAAAAFLLGSSTLLASFAGTDLFVPMVGRQAGIFPSNWYTTVWIYNPGAAAATARIYLLERGTANPSPPWVEVLVPPGDSEKLENIVESLFHTQVFGALRVTCDTQKLVVTSRVYSNAAGAGEKDSVGQDFAAVPASFAIGAGEKTQVLGMHQTLPSADSDCRSNFGFVETTGHQVNVRVRAFDEAGVDLGYKDFNVREWSQRQVAFKDHFPNVSTENVRLEVEVLSGTGKVIAYGSMIANGTQDPTTLEMAYDDSLLGIANVHHDTTLVGDGTAGAPLALADGAVATAKLADGAVTAAKIAPGAVGAQQLPDQVVTAGKLADAAVTVHKLATSSPPAPAPGNAGTLRADPLEAFFKIGDSMFWDLAFTGDMTAVNTAADSGLTGGVAAGDANLAIAAGGVSSSMLADNAVSSAKIINGTIAGDDVAFNYAGSTSKGGAAADVACTGCVAATELSASGSSSGQVLTSNGSAVVWGSGEGLTLPYHGEPNTSDDAFFVENHGTGPGVVGFSGTTGVSGFGPTVGVRGDSDNGAGVFGKSTYSDINIETEPARGVGVHGLSVHGFGVMGSGGVGVGGYGSSQGVFGNATAAGGKGVYGMSVFGHGVLGDSYYWTSAGVLGASYGASWGVKGTNTNGTSGYLAGAYGAYGEQGTASGYLGGDYGAFGTKGSTAGYLGGTNGVYGSSPSGNGVEGVAGSMYGVYGHGLGDGVHGETSGASAKAVSGSNTSTSTSGYIAGTNGVYGSSGSGYGVEGYSVSSYGVYGHSDNHDGVRARTSAAGRSGVYAEAMNSAATAVGGVNTNGSFGSLGSTNGVEGGSTFGYGVYAHSNGLAAVRAESGSPKAAAIYATHSLAGGDAVVGENTFSGAKGYLGHGYTGVYAIGAGEFNEAGYFEGSVQVTSLKGTGNRPVYSTADGILTNSSSDARLKKEVVGLSAEVDVLAALAGLRGVAFNWDATQQRARNLGGQREIGLIAQEVEAVLPQVVGETADGYKTLDYAKLTALLIEVAKAQQAEITGLKERVRQLEAAPSRSED